MAEITGIAGLSGSGKTTLLSNRAWKDHLLGYTNYSNYDLDFSGNIKIPFKKRYADNMLDFIPLFEPKDLFKIRAKGKFAIHLDEIDSWGADENFTGGVDSYDYQSESARLVAFFFKKRLRKMDGIVDYTVQHMGQIPKRIREETEYVLKPQIWQKWDPFGTGKKSVPLRIKIEEDRINVTTGEFVKTQIVNVLASPPLEVYALQNNLTVPYSLKYITLPMLNIFNTKGNLLSANDLPEESKNRSPLENVENEKILFSAVEKLFGPAAIIEQLKQSGRYSKWHGDVLVNVSGKQLILDVTSVRNRYKSGDKHGKALSLDVSKKWKKIPEMLAIDEKTGSIHFFAYFDVDPIEPLNSKKWKWNVIPVEVLKNECHLSSRMLRNSKLITPEKNLRVQNCGPLQIKNLKKFIKAPGKEIYEAMEAADQEG